MALADQTNYWPLNAAIEAPKSRRIFWTGFGVRSGADEKVRTLANKTQDRLANITNTSEVCQKEAD